jgi:hypothetical protein
MGALSDEAGRNLDDDDLRRAWIEGLRVLNLALTEHRDALDDYIKVAAENGHARTGANMMLERFVAIGETEEQAERNIGALVQAFGQFLSLYAADPGALVTAAVTGVAEAFQAHQRLLRVFILLGTAHEAVLREGTEASTDGGRAFRRFLGPVAPHVRQPDAEEALDFAFRLVFATCAHRVVRGEHLESARPLSWRRLTEELAEAVRRYRLD